MRFNRMVFSGDLEGSGGGAAPSPSPSPEGTPAGAPEAAPAGPSPWLVKLGDARPEEVPEKFWDAEQKALNAEALLKSFKETEAWRGKRAEAYKAEIMKELRDGVPEKADGYTLELSKFLPEGVQPNAIPNDDPFIVEMREVAHEAGIKPDQWDRMVKAFVGHQLRGFPDVAAETAKLGEGGDARIAAVDMWLANTLPEAQYKALEGTITNAAAVEAIETLMRAAKQDGRVGGGQGLPGGGSGASEAEARAAMRDPEYYARTPKGEQLRAVAAAWASSKSRAA